MGGGKRVLHTYFVSRMLFTPDQSEGLLRNGNAEFWETVSAAQRDRLSRALVLDHVNRVSYLDSRSCILYMLLGDTDVMRMPQGLEVRVPLIDHQLAKTVMGIPSAAKMGATPKGLLVEALARSLRDEILHRAKRGFTLPFEHWMRL